jgi:hypothetical protein
MSSFIARSAIRAAPRVRSSPIPRRWASAAAEGERAAGKDALQKGAKRDPELYVCCEKKPPGERPWLIDCHRCSWPL